MHYILYVLYIICIIYNIADDEFQLLCFAFGLELDDVVFLTFFTFC